MNYNNGIQMPWTKPRYVEVREGTGRKINIQGGGI